MSKRAKLLMRENNELEKRIKPEDQQILTDIVVYIRSANISPYHQEIVRRDIWQMFLDGEGRGLKAGEIIGEDYKAFCDNVIRELPQMSGWQRFWCLVRDCLPAAAVLITVWFCFRVFECLIGLGRWPYFMITVGNGISFVLILFAASSILAFLSKKVFQNNKATNKMLFFMVFAMMLACICLNFFARQPLFEIHAVFVLAGILLLLGGYKALDSWAD